MAAIVDKCSTRGHWTSRPWAIGAWMRLSLAHVTDTRWASRTPGRPHRAGYKSRFAYRSRARQAAGRGAPAQVTLARKDNQAWAAGELGCPVIAAPYGCRRPYKPCLLSQPRQASATSRQPESMVRE